METSPSFMERDMALHTVIKADGGNSDSIVEIGSGATYYKPKPPLNSIVQPQSNTRSEIKHALVGLGVLTETDVKSFVENHMSKWTNTL